MRFFLACPSRETFEPFEDHEAAITHAVEMIPCAGDDGVGEVDDFLLFPIGDGFSETIEGEHISEIVASVWLIRNANTVRERIADEYSSDGDRASLEKVFPAFVINHRPARCEAILEGENVCLDGQEADRDPFARSHPDALRLV